MSHGPTESTSSSARSWLSPWPPPGYLPTEEVVQHFRALALLRDWWWAWLDGSLYGYRLSAEHLDALWIPPDELAGHCRMDRNGAVLTQRAGYLTTLVEDLLSEEDQEAPA